MKKKMVCFALSSVLGFCTFVVPVHATSDEYGQPMDGQELRSMEDDVLSPNYEIELEESDQPFITDESFPLEGEVGEDVLGEQIEEYMK